MPYIESKLPFERVLELAAARGLSHLDVLYANLVHLAMVGRSPDVLTYLTQRDENLQVNNPAQQTMENYLTHLPRHIADVVVGMAVCGALNMDKAMADWLVMESILNQNDPQFADSMSKSWH